MLPAFFLRFWPCHGRWWLWLWSAELFSQFLLFSNWSTMYLWADIVGDFCTECSIVHEEDVQILHVADDKFLEPIGEIVSGLFVWAVSNFGHGFITPESSSHSVIDAWRWECGYHELSSSWERVCQHIDRIGTLRTSEFSSSRFSFWEGEWIWP